MTPDDNTTKIIDAISRLETRNEQRFMSVEQRIVPLGEAVARLEVHVGNIKEVHSSDNSRMSEEHGGARQWLAILFSSLMGLLSMAIALTRHK